MQKSKKDFDITILSYYNCWENQQEMMENEYVYFLQNRLQKDNIDCLVEIGGSYDYQWSISVNKINLEKTLDILKAEKHKKIKYREENIEGNEYVKVGFHF